MREPRRILPLAAHVVEDEHDAAGPIRRDHGSALHREVDRHRARRGGSAARCCLPSRRQFPRRMPGGPVARPDYSGDLVLDPEHRRQREFRALPRFASRFSRSATGLMYSTLPAVSIVMTASAIDASVTCARSFSCNVCASARLQSDTSASDPAIRCGLPRSPGPSGRAAGTSDSRRRQRATWPRDRTDRRA